MQQCESKFAIYKVPQSLIQNESNYSVIPILDASGSMSGVWKAMIDKWNQLAQKIPTSHAITFSNNANIIESQNVYTNINQYGGGGTEIFSAFEKLIQYFKEQKDLPVNITILFFSDGADNNSQTINQRLSKLNDQFAALKKMHSINFLCIGIGKGFPTFLGMQLREYLHSGDQSIPPVFTVQTSSSELQKSLEEQFSVLSNYLVQRTSMEIHPPVALYPWEPENLTNKVYAGLTFAILNEQKQDYFITNGQKEPLEELKYVSGQDILDISRKWVQKLQLESLKNSVNEKAKQVIRYIQQLEENESQLYAKDKKQSVMNRLVKRSNEVWKQDLQILINALKELAENALNKLSEAEAAKRLAIGTRVGKFHAASLKFCAVDKETYNQMRDEIVGFLKTQKIDFENSDQEKSVICLQNMKDILGEADIVQALSICPSQFDLVEVVPLVGHGVFIKRFDAMLITPWLTEVLSVARHHSTVDTVSIYADANKTLNLNTGDGDIEKINAVLPLFTDEDMIPFIRSRFFNLLMTFNMLHNVDCCYDTSHSALAANVFLYLIQQEPSEWRNNLISRIQKMFSIKYAFEEEFNDMKATMLSETPALALVNDHPSLKHKNQDASKPLIILLDLLTNKYEKIKPNLKEIIIRIIGEEIGRLYPNQVPVYKYFDFDQEVVQNFVNSEKIIEAVQKELADTQFTSRTDLKQQIHDHVLELLKQLKPDFSIKVNLAKITWLQYKYNMKSFNAIYRFFLGQDFPMDIFISVLYHASKYRNSFERNKKPLSLDLNEIIRNINEEILLALSPISTIESKLYELFHGKLNQEDDSHRFITPISYSKLQKYCKDNGINIKDLKYHRENNITYQACLNTDCPNYLEPMYCYRSHYNAFIPVRYSFYTLVKQNKNLSTNEIRELCSQSNKRNIRKFADSQHCLDLIDHLKDVYNILEE